MKRLLTHFIPIVVVFFIFQNKGFSQKTDTIVHINGNILTGDFKKMEYGVASWDMTGLGTVNLEEYVINTIRSKKLFEIKLKNGLVYFGSFGLTEAPRKVYIIKSDGKELIAMDDIVEIYPIKKTFWNRTTGNFSLGANFSKGSNVGTIAFSGNLSYRKRKTYSDLTWDLNNTYQGDTLSSNKTDVSLTWQRLLKNQWSAGVIVGTTQNSELGTKLRINLSGVGLKDLAYNSWNRLYAGTGLSVARETPYDNGNITTNLAGLFQVVWKVYKYSSPKIWVNSNINYVPYFTGPERYLASFNLNPQVSIFSNNFKVGFTLYYNYDSNPTSDASTNDYGLNLQFTYSFH
ncbi:DUF481 domain-containing protein [Formosa sp. PL04]|uniref:DUF481 domain-containing protein n=1 Tax=Formosa sp. PL04 TaxID=3081755 RepID=UPI002980BDB1|nr:DUF481 domain-containing protein [Formosa sp. PL04]MDW5288916.1 DUF481 domain-containing protein [Formosa sp. PL04]